MGVIPTPLAERYWPKVDRRGPNECWPWLASIDGVGYGQISMMGHNGPEKAHRVALFLAFGEWPAKGAHTDHLCRNRVCQNPRHLEVVTPRENMRRGIGRIAERFVQTECLRGHIFTSANTYITSRGSRRCRTCHRDRERKRNSRITNSRCAPSSSRDRYPHLQP